MQCRHIHCTHEYWMHCSLYLTGAGGVERWGALWPRLHAQAQGWVCGRDEQDAGPSCSWPNVRFGSISVPFFPLSPTLLSHYPPLFYPIIPHSFIPLSPTLLSHYPPLFYPTIPLSFHFLSYYLPSQSMCTYPTIEALLLCTKICCPRWLHLSNNHKYSII